MFELSLIFAMGVVLAVAIKALSQKQRLRGQLIAQQRPFVAAQQRLREALTALSQAELLELSETGLSQALAPWRPDHYIAYQVMRAMGRGTLKESLLVELVEQGDGDVWIGSSYERMLTTDGQQALEIKINISRQAGELSMFGHTIALDQPQWEAFFADQPRELKLFEADLLRRVHVTEARVSLYFAQELALRQPSGQLDAEAFEACFTRWLEARQLIGGALSMLDLAMLERQLVSLSYVIKAPQMLSLLASLMAESSFAAAHQKQLRKELEPLLEQHGERATTVCLVWLAFIQAPLPFTLSDDELLEVAALLEREEALIEPTISQHQDTFRPLLKQAQRYPKINSALLLKELERLDQASQQAFLLLLFKRDGLLANVRRFEAILTQPPRRSWANLVLAYSAQGLITTELMPSPEFIDEASRALLALYALAHQAAPLVEAPVQLAISHKLIELVQLVSSQRALRATRALDPFFEGALAESALYGDVSCLDPLRVLARTTHLPPNIFTSAGRAATSLHKRLMDEGYAERGAISLAINGEQLGSLSVIDSVQGQLSMLEAEHESKEGEAQEP